MKLKCATLIIMLITSGSISAEVWKCGKNLYASEIKPNLNCIEVPASVICGSDGNKYIGPSTQLVNLKSQVCGSNVKSKNIFASEDLASKPKTAGLIEQNFEEKPLKKNNSKDSKTDTPTKLLGMTPGDLIKEILSNPKFIEQLSKTVFPSLQEDFSD